MPYLDTGEPSFDMRLEILKTYMELDQAHRTRLLDAAKNLRDQQQDES